MGLFDFGKKKEEPARGPVVPVEDVIRLRRQGLSNNQIVQALLRNGFQTHQIFDAFSQADLRVPSPVQGAQQSQMPPPQLGMPPEMPPSPLDAQDEEGMPQPQEGELPEFGQEAPQQYQPQGFEPQPQYEAGHDVSAKVEEISEAIIEEKWQDLMKDFSKIMEWKGSMEQRMAAIEQRMADLKSGFDSLQKSVVDKVSDYDKSVRDVGSEMKALEQVFQKIIPTLTENVNELSRITKGMKPASEKKKL